MDRKIWLSSACALTLMLGASQPAQAAGELRMYNWFEYFPQELIDKFKAEHDIQITIDTYDSNEALLARLKAGVTGYDVAVPGEYMTKILIDEGLIQDVDANQLANFGNIPEQWVDVYWDPGREYSIPYQWGSTGFMVDTETYSGDIDTLAILFEPPAELSGKINLLRDVNDVINAGLRYLGHPRCNADPAQLKEVNDLLLAAKDHWLSFSSDGAKEVLVSGDAAAGMIWNGFGMKAREERASLKYAYPKEGFTGWMDNIVVLNDAPNLDNARTFMNFMLEPENAAMLTNFARYSAGVSGVEPFLDDVLATAHELNPPADAPAPEFVPPCPEEVVRLYDRIWTNLLK